MLAKMKINKLSSALSLTIRIANEKANHYSISNVFSQSFLWAITGLFTLYRFCFRRPASAFIASKCCEFGLSGAYILKSPILVSLNRYLPAYIYSIFLV